MTYEAIALIRQALAARKRDLRVRFEEQVREAYAAKTPELDALVMSVAERQGVTLTDEQRARLIDDAKAQVAVAERESTRAVTRTFDRVLFRIVRASEPHAAARTARRHRAARARRRSRRVARRVTRAGPDDDGPPAEPPPRAHHDVGGAP